MPANLIKYLINYEMVLQRCFGRIRKEKLRQNQNSAESKFGRIKIKQKS
ncbi:hypothetical protein L21SP2_3188 [Salinispira pacifica]|uniref:Uncharacterized protein n=1 Tax=Salinispira pacifica TaxID=1307761 RepID=V5WLP2_9SPIO|nr:hypothetical protein L21SP2_3188 [Salinispira pacifica]